MNGDGEEEAREQHSVIIVSDRSFSHCDVMQCLFWQQCHVTLFKTPAAATDTNYYLNVSLLLSLASQALDT